MPNIHELLTERVKTHGDYADQALMADQINRLVASTRMSQVAQHTIYMIATKMSRIACGNPNEPDHWRDIAGYATLMADLLEKNHA